MSKLIDSTKLAETLGIPRHTLDQWAYSGRGPTFVKVGRHRRYRPEDIESWLQENTVHPKGAA